MGAHLYSAEPGLDSDRFDPYCHHLVVRDAGDGRIVGYTRILTDLQARLAGGWYSATEFDLEAVLALPGRFLEIGRTSIHPDHRTGATIAVLWSGLAQLVSFHRFDYLMGCASIEMDDGGLRARAIADRLRERSMTPDDLRVRPHLPLPSVPPDLLAATAPVLPPLLKAYLRLGARACGEPCWDPDFGVADLSMLLDVQDLQPRYARQFLERVEVGWSQPAVAQAG